MNTIWNKYRSHRFFLPKESFLEEGQIRISDEGVLWQFIKVFRSKEGDGFIALDNEENEYLAEIQAIQKKEIQAKILETRKNEAEPKTKISLFQAIPKQSKFEHVLDFGTQSGISEFVPLITERTEKRNFSPHQKERFLKILKESAEQSGRGKIPTLSSEILWNDTLRQNEKEEHLNVILDASGQNFLKDIGQKNLLKNPTSLHIFVGPEGGFSEKELREAKEHGFHILTLGNRIFRTENAGGVAAALLLQI